MLDVHDRMMRGLEQAGRLDRDLEALPDGEEVAERSAAQHRPDAARARRPARLQQDHPLRGAARLRPARGPGADGRAGGLLPRAAARALRRPAAAHRLRREIIATQVTNGVVDRAGITFVFRLQEETGAAPADIARAYAVARDVFGMRGFWAEVEALDLEVDGRHADRDAARGPPPRRARHALAPAQPAAPARHRRRDRAVRRRAPPRSPSALPDVLVAGEREAFEARVRGARRGRRAAPSSPAASRASATSSPRSTSSAWPAPTSARSARSRRCTSSSAAGCSCTGCATGSPRSRARTAGRRWPAPRCATISSASTQSSPPTSCARRRRRAADAEARLDGWIDAQPAAGRPLPRHPERHPRGGTYDLTTLPVALRELRNLSRVSGAH